MSPLATFFTWLRKKQATRAMERAEHKRAVVRAQLAYRKPRHREYKYLIGVMREATNASLEAAAQMRGR